MPLVRIGLFLSVHMDSYSLGWYGYNDELPRQEIKDAAEYQRNESTTHDDHVVRHAEIWGGQVY